MVYMINLQPISITPLSKTEIDVCWQCIANKFVIKNRSKTEKGIGIICFTTGEQTDFGTAEIYPK